MARNAFTEADILAMLRVRFPDPAYAFLPHVADGTGGYGSRTADAIIMSVWPSRGLDLMGVEVKCSRGDWLTEMRNPAKAEGIAKYMDRWWLAVADRTIVKPGELPPTWGLLAVHGTSLRVEVEAPKLEPRPLNRAFVAAVFRSAARKLVEPDGVTALLAAERDKAYAEGLRDARRHGWIEGDKQKYEGLKASVAAFEQASGIKIDDYPSAASTSARMGDAVRFLIQHDGWGKVLAALESIRRADEDLHTVLSDARLSDMPDFRSWSNRR